MYTAIRALDVPTSTTTQLQTLLTLMTLPLIERIDMFASQITAGESPCLVLMATGDFAGIGQAQVVFDTLTISARDQAHYAQLRQLINLGVATRKVHFRTARAPRTAQLHAREAVSTLQALAPAFLLEHANRHQFFALFSPVPEVDFTDVRPG